MSNKPFMVTFLFLLLFSCEDSDSDSGLSPDNEDSQGNLVVINQSDYELVLYSGTSREKILPATSEDFLINIPNPSQETKDLKLFLLDSVKDDINNPNLESIYKRWSVALSNGTGIEGRVTWFVKGNQNRDDIGTGDLTLSYVGGTENSVDVFLNNSTGAKIASLSPGAQNRRVGLAYGTYTALFKYWYSDQQSTAGQSDIGWREKEVINGNEVDIFVVLNAARESRHLQIPHWDGGGAIDEQYGSVKIRNYTSSPIIIYTGSDLIENVMYTDDVVDNYSTIPANDNITYLMPVDEYLFSARDTQTSQSISDSTFSIVADSLINWNINE
jgi:hypothetical protein